MRASTAAHAEHSIVNGSCHPNGLLASARIPTLLRKTTVTVRLLTDTPTYREAPHAGHLAKNRSLQPDVPVFGRGSLTFSTTCTRELLQTTGRCWMADTRGATGLPDFKCASWGYRPQSAAGWWGT
jgi:hypothetical protein